MQPFFRVFFKLYLETVFSNFQKQYQTFGPKFFYSNKTVIIRSQNCPFSDLKKGFESSRRDLLSCTIRIALGAQKRLLFYIYMPPWICKPLFQKSVNQEKAYTSECPFSRKVSNRIISYTSGCPIEKKCQSIKNIPF